MHIFHRPHTCLNRFSISKRLIISSAALTICLVILSTFFTDHFMQKLTVQEQVAFEQNAFNQAKSYMNTTFDTLENCINKIHNSAVIKSALFSPYDPGNVAATYSNNTSLDEELGTIFLGSDYFQQHIFIGRNGYSHIYTPDSRGSALKGVYDFSALLSETSLSEYTDSVYSLFYYTRDTSRKNPGVSFNHLTELLDKQLILLYPLKDNNDTLQGISIVIMNNTFISKILAPGTPGQNLCLLDNHGSVIWQAAYTPKDILTFSPDFSLKTPGHSILAISQKEYLSVWEPLMKDCLILASLTPLESIYNQKSSTFISILIFGLLYLGFVVLITFFFSRFITNPIEDLSDKIKKESFMSEPSLKKSKWIHRLFHVSIKKKMFIYYLLCVIFPTILFITLTTAVSFDTYKKQITKFTNHTVSLISTNIDYKLNYLEFITQQLAYSDELQEALISHDENPDFSAAEKLFLNAKSTLPSFLSLDLYDLSFNKIYSSFYFHRITATDQARIRELLNNSSGRLTFLDSTNTLTTNSVLNFARLIRGKDQRFGRLIAYGNFSFDENYFNSVIQDISFSNSGYLFITDPNGHILSSRQDIVISEFSKKDILHEDLSVRQPFTLDLNGTNYLAFISASDKMNFYAIGLIPQKDFFLKISPTLFMNLGFLLLSILSILAVSAIVSSSITIPIRNLQTAMFDLQHDHFSGPCPVQGSDEIAVLTQQFNEMTNHLHTLIYENYQSQLRESELQLLEKEAQLKALQQQINPHFLYNTLDAIKWMAYKKGIMEICEMTTALGKFFRGSISRGHDIVTFRQELDHLKSYIYIQQLRFPEKFTIQWEISDDVMNCRILKLILQPIVENSINHGIESMENGALITIRAFIRQSTIFVEISDNGVGMTPEQLSALNTSLTKEGSEAEHESIGLKNVYRRLVLRYGADCSFIIESTYGSGTIVRMTLPQTF